MEVTNVQKTRIGFHVGKSDAVGTMIDFVRAGFGCFQIFVAGPSSSTLYKFSEQDIDNAREYVSPLADIYVHSSYVTHPWKGKQWSTNQIAVELKLAAKLGSKGYVVHLPRYEILLTADETAVNPLCKGVLDKLQALTVETGVQVILEIQASSSNTIARVEVVADELNSRGLFLCIDTAHLWSSGIDVSTLAKFNAWFTPKIQTQTALFHLNDSEIVLGGKKDVHGIPPTGKIWGSGNGPIEFASIVEYIKSIHIPIIFEAVPTQQDMEKLL